MEQWSILLIIPCHVPKKCPDWRWSELTCRWHWWKSQRVRQIICIYLSDICLYQILFSLTGFSFYYIPRFLLLAHSLLYPHLHHHHHHHHHRHHHDHHSIIIIIIINIGAFEKKFPPAELRYKIIQVSAYVNVIKHDNIDKRDSSSFIKYFYC